LTHHTTIDYEKMVVGIDIWGHIDGKKTPTNFCCH